MVKVTRNEESEVAIVESTRGKMLLRPKFDTELGDFCDVYNYETKNEEYVGEVYCTLGETSDEELASKVEELLDDMGM